MRLPSAAAGRSPIARAPGSPRRSPDCRAGPSSRSVHVKSRPATSGVPSVWNMPGEMSLHVPVRRRLAIVRDVVEPPERRWRSVGSVGSRVVNAADATPGMAASLSRMSLLHAHHALPDRRRRSRGIETLNVCTCSGSHESRLDAAQRLETADHQPGAHQQHQRQRHLDRHAAPVATADARASG